MNQLPDYLYQISELATLTAMKLKLVYSNQDILFYPDCCIL